jgi:hypothetical protein
MTTKVRFHLGRGPNYQRWQVRFGDNPPEYFDPEDVILEMHNAVLRNQRGTAEKILNGENKTAWGQAVLPLQPQAPSALVQQQPRGHRQHQAQVAGYVRSAHHYPTNT